MKFSCPHCDQHIDAPDESAGQQVNCPTCAKPVCLPQPLQTPKASGFPDWLRWVLVLPTAIVCSIVARLAGEINLYMFPFLSDSFVQFWNCIMGSAFLVVGGAQSAPKHRFIVALTLTVVWAIFSGVGIAMFFLTGKHSDPLFLWYFVCDGGGIVATVIVCVVYHQMETKARLKDALARVP